MYVCMYTCIYIRTYIIIAFIIQSHLKDECQMVTVSCPNEGCSEIIAKSQLDDHVQDCQYPTWSINDQLSKQDFSSSNGSTAKGRCHYAFLGCHFVGKDSELTKHIEKDVSSHLNDICKFLSSNGHSSHMPNDKLSTSVSNEAMKQLLFTDIDKVKAKIGHVSNEGDKTKSQATEIQEKQKEIAFRLNGVEDLLSTIQASITEINRSYEEASLTLQTLQATSYNGNYIWKIPDITRRRRDAVMGKTVSLYSAPFYTDRFGYRMCLRVYLDGDGSGKGRYISFFLTIMKGEYDALLEWPFQLTVTLTMINQKGNGNIVQSFKPNPNSASFHRPKSDMNVASGCPKFAALSVLDNPEFIVDDVAFFQCVVRQQQVNS